MSGEASDESLSPADVDERQRLLHELVLKGAPLEGGERCQWGLKPNAVLSQCCPETSPH